MKYLGIDYGLRRIGIATSDEEGKMAFPREIIENDKDVFETINKIIEIEKISEIVLGESLNYKGEKNEIMGKIEEFKKDLENKFKLPVHYEQEFLTSHQAHKTRKQESNKARKFTLLNSSKGRPAKQDLIGKVDDSSATIILQTYLDRNL